MTRTTKGGAWEGSTVAEAMHPICECHIKRPALWICLALAAVLAFCLLLWTTPYGIGVDPDSTVYLGVSESILKGDGFRIRGEPGATEAFLKGDRFQIDGEPMTHWPPGYPLLLALVGRLNGDQLQRARLLHAVLFAASTFLVGLAAYLIAGGSFLSTIASVLIFICSVDMLKVHTWALSEAPFIFFTVAAFVAVVLFVMTRHLLLLVLCSFLIGVSLIMRYVGLAVVPPIVVTLLLQRKPLRIRIRESSILIAIASAPLIAWLIRSIFVSNAIANRHFVFHPIDFEKMKQALRTLCHFWLPFEFGMLHGPLLLTALMLLMVVVFGLILYGFVIVTKNAFENIDRLDVGVLAQITLLSFCVTYFVFLLVSVSFFDAETPFNYRILSPVYVFGSMFLVSFICSLMKLGSKRWISYALIGLVIVSVFANGLRAVSSTRELRSDGRGYMARKWKGSETIAFVRSLPAGFTLYSNASDAIRFLAGRESKFLPRKIFSASLLANASFNRELSMMVHDVREGPAVIVYFNDNVRPWLLPETEIASLPGVYPILKFPDGSVYGRRDWEKPLAGQYWGSHKNRRASE